MSKLKQWIGYKLITFGSGLIDKARTIDTGDDAWPEQQAEALPVAKGEVKKGYVKD